MKALTLWQPWASLIAVGAETIQTRSWSTSYSGRLAIHAAKRRPTEAEVGGFGLSYYPAPDGWYMTDAMGVLHDLPLGAIVATCTLADVVPIGGEHAFRSANWMGDEQEHQAQTVCVVTDGSFDRPVLCLDRPNERPSILDITDQLPYGDFTPGRYAWLLEDVKPTTARCPACWGESLSELDIMEHLRHLTDGRFHDSCRPCVKRRTGGGNGLCPTCDGKGTCDPVPAKGRQGLWEWKS